MSNKSASFHLGSPGGPTCVVSVLPIQSKAPDGTIHAALLDADPSASEVELLRTIVSRFGVQWGHDELGWWAAVLQPEFPSWLVWRLEDNGNTFLVQANLTESGAIDLVQHYESLGHKQSYWARDEKCSQAWV